MRVRLLFVLLLVGLVSSARGGAQNPVLHPPLSPGVWAGTLYPTTRAHVSATARLEAHTRVDSWVDLTAHGLVRRGRYSLLYGEADSDLRLLGNPDDTEANGRGELHMRRLLPQSPASDKVHLVLCYRDMWSPPLTVAEGLLDLQVPPTTGVAPFDTP